MKTWTAAIALIGLGWIGQAEAGLGLFKHRVAAYGASIPGTTAGYSSGYSGAVAGGEGLPVKPYSYYAAAPGTARGYFGYGQDEFPYNGRAYGHPYDPWTWPYMSSSYQNGLQHYYHPPVP